MFTSDEENSILVNIMEYLSTCIYPICILVYLMYTVCDTNISITQCHTFLYICMYGIYSINWICIRRRTTTTCSLIWIKHTIIYLLFITIMNGTYSTNIPKLNVVIETCHIFVKYEIHIPNLPTERRWKYKCIRKLYFSSKYFQVKKKWKRNTY